MKEFERQKRLTDMKRLEAENVQEEIVTLSSLPSPVLQLVTHCTTTTFPQNSSFYPSLSPPLYSLLTLSLPPSPPFFPPSFFNSSLSHSLSSLPPSPPFPFPSTNLPGKCLASSAHLFPMALCVDKIVLSSSSLHGFLLMSGFK